jgi:hypothetical protein
MACQKCASNKSTSCSCQSTSYTIPSNAVYGDSNCRLPAEPCDSVTCTECVRHCHGEDKWCTKYPTMTGNVLLCMHKGERLDQFLQKMALAHSNGEIYPYMVKSFYVNELKGGANWSINFIWFDFDSSVTSIKLQYKPEGSGDWQTINAFNSLNTLTANTFTLDSTMATLAPGTTYVFRLGTTTVTSEGVPGTVYPEASVYLYVTIPTT